MCASIGGDPAETHSLPASNSATGSQCKSGDSKDEDGRGMSGSFQMVMEPDYLPWRTKAHAAAPCSSSSCVLRFARNAKAFESGIELDDQEHRIVRRPLEPH